MDPTPPTSGVEGPTVTRPRKGVPGVRVPSPSKVDPRKGVPEVDPLCFLF